MNKKALFTALGVSVLILAGCGNKQPYKGLGVTLDQFVADFNQSISQHHLTVKPIGEIKPRADGMYVTRESASSMPSVDVGYGCFLSFSMKDEKVHQVIVRVTNRDPADQPNGQCYSAAILAADKTLTLPDATKLMSDLPATWMDWVDGEGHTRKIHAIIKGDYYYGLNIMNINSLSLRDLNIMRSNN